MREEDTERTVKPFGSRPATRIKAVTGRVVLPLPRFTNHSPDSTCTPPMGGPKKLSISFHSGGLELHPL